MASPHPALVTIAKLSVSDDMATVRTAQLDGRDCQVDAPRVEGVSPTLWGGLVPEHVICWNRARVLSLYLNSTMNVSTGP